MYNYSKRLTLEDKENLAELLRHPGIRPLLVQVDELVEVQEKEVLATASEDEKQLVITKARLEGARKLLRDLGHFINQSKSASDR